MDGFVASGIVKESVFYLLIAGLVDLGIAFMPAWALAEGSNLFSHAIHSFDAVLQETVNQPNELVAIFWLPFSAGIVCLGATLAVLFGSQNMRSVIFIPITITVLELVYFFVIRLDIHIMAVSLLPLTAAWWEYRKAASGRTSAV